MNTPLLYEYHARQAPWIKHLGWVITILLVPAGFGIFFTEGRNVVQLASIEAVGILSGIGIYALMRWTEKKVATGNRLEIDSKGVLRWTLRSETKEIPLTGIQSIRGGSDLAMMQMMFESKNGEKFSQVLPGVFPKADRDAFFQVASKFGVQFP